MHQLDSTIRDALIRSRLGDLPADVLSLLTQDATRLELPPGSIFAQEGTPPSTFLVVTGLLRGFLTSAFGRQTHVRYARPGDLIGTATLFFGPHRLSGQALTRAVVLALNGATLVRVAPEDARVGFALCTELAERVQGHFDQLYGTAFGTLRQRVIRHLLDRCTQGSRDSEPVTTVTQQDLADAVGSGSEVVARVLLALRKEGLIATTADVIVLLDPLRLHAEGWSSAV